MGSPRVSENHGYGDGFGAHSAATSEPGLPTSRRRRGSGRHRTCTPSHQHRTVCAADEGARHAPRKPAAPRPDDNELRVAQPGELLESPRGDPMQLLAAGRHTGAARGRDTGGYRPLADPHLGVETTLVIRLPERGRGATADVDE